MALERTRRPLPVNEGPLDRAIRIVIGLALISMIFTGPRTLWGLLGFIPLITGTAGYCLLYAVFGFSTIGAPHRARHA